MTNKTCRRGHALTPDNIVGKREPRCRACHNEGQRRRYVNRERGSALAVPGGAQAVSCADRARFWSHVDKTESCWEWTAFKDSHGYGRFTYSPTLKLTAHRVAYELEVGPIPDGLYLDHICHNTSCVRPSHLRPVTNKQNQEHRSGAPRNSSTGVLGVTRTRSGRFKAQVYHYKKCVYVGTFDTAHEAETATIAKRNELFTHNNNDRSRTHERE